MKYFVVSLFFLLVACAAPLKIQPLNQTTSLRTVALIMGEPNFTVDGGYQELEEGFYTAPELKPGKKMFAPVQDIITQLGGKYALKAGTGSATISLAGHTVSLTANSLDALVDGQRTQTDIAPELRNSRLWVSLPWLFEQLGAWVKWEEARQRFSAVLLLQNTKNTEAVTRGGPVQERSMTAQAAGFYASADGRKLADIIASYQNTDGGWPKLEPDINMLVPVNTARLSGYRIRSTIDNDSTTKQLIVLAKVYTQTRAGHLLSSFNRGLDYLLDAQLPNGGWQQFWPAPLGYKRRITFNDDAIANVLEVMHDVTLRGSDYSFVDAQRRERASRSLDKGLALILRTQIAVAGRKTGWCAQYTEDTLQPAAGRAFELASLSGHESVNILKFLMKIDTPSPAIRTAIEDAIRWLDSAKLTGLRRVKREDRTLESGFDYILQEDPAAPALWARFYDLQNGRPLFAARDGKPRNNFADVPYERRVKYDWFTESPRELLERDYPAWQQRTASSKTSPSPNARFRLSQPHP